MSAYTEDQALIREGLSPPRWRTEDEKYEAALELQEKLVNELRERIHQLEAEVVRLKAELVWDGDVFGSLMVGFHMESADVD